MATLTLTATPEPDNVPPRVRLDVTDSGSPAITTVTIRRLDADGRRRLVRTADAGPLALGGASATLYDYEAWFGTPSTYSITEANAPTATAQLDSEVPWLVHVGVPSRSVPLHVTEFGDVTRGLERGVFPILGRAEPIVVTGSARTAPASALGVRTKTDAERSALDAVLADGSPLLLNIPVGLGWGVDTCYVSIGDVTQSRTIDYAGHPWREWSLPYQVVGRPSGGTQAAITWDDVAEVGADDYTADPASQYLTWSAITAAEVPSWAELASPTT